MNAFTLGSALLLGLFGGVHCVVMCGGIVGVLCAGLPPEVRAQRRFRYLLSYNLGRITTYSLLGLVAGGLGTASIAALPLQAAQIALRLVAALALIGAGVYLAGLFHGFARVEALGGPLFGLVKPWINRLGPVRTPGRAALLGGLWGFLPCGLVYAAVALALVAGSAAAGAATMLAFGLGTLPALLVIGGFASVVRNLSRIPRIRRTAGVLIALSGSIHLMMTGLQAGWLPASLLGEKPACCAGAH